MVYISTEQCHVCKQHTTFTNNICKRCKEKEFKEMIKLWDSKTNEEKFLDIHKRLLAIENKNDIKK